MPIREFAHAIRPGRRVSVATALVVILSAAACSAIIPTPVKSWTPALGSTVYGNDISWPQCPKGVGGFDLPGPMASASFVVIGLTDGGSFRANPCLARQVASGKTAQLWTGAYAMASYPTNQQLTRYGGTGSLLVRLGRVGAAQARFNLTTMARVGLRAPIIWVDVEPNKRTPWSANADRNNAVLDGVIAAYRTAGLSTGIYSFDRAWKKITAGRVMPGVPTWVPVGDSTRAVAAAACAETGHAGRKPWLTQWTDGVRDYNLTCPGVTGQPARGNPLTPYLHIRLVTGSRGDAVAPLQRRLGVSATGTFDSATRASVVSFQRAQQMTINGIVDRPMWRALGAGSGTYKPLVRGFMGSLFASP